MCELWPKRKVYSKVKAHAGGSEACVKAFGPKSSVLSLFLKVHRAGFLSDSRISDEIKGENDHEISTRPTAGFQNKFLLANLQKVL